jgi:hypothetical protein
MMQPLVNIALLLLYQIDRNGMERVICRISLVD